ncbi:sensor histidine kinase [Acidaminobacter hydrogenoformans]|uniref:histidine kinase n=1 Tax=Acidaminobacter hydrogenoformans DSM 2784 TaxID=1120920 RepID=A0A1G5S4Z2_9FIRM|nr:HAMP domain-containing sensor histidine kinase [Acidaminobacter hydrogenoformans]SCZ81472.1 Signal transduction histidine kinase [Acidaminobacter hydrogenoformans DSM 2784]
MKHTLRGRLTRFLLASALVSGLTALLLTNAALYDTFYNYKEAVQLESARDFSEYTSRIYQINGGWTGKTQAMLLAYPGTDQFGFRIYDTQDYMVLNSQLLPDRVSFHQSMMRRMGRNAIFFQKRFYDGTEILEEIVVNGETIGTVELVYPSTFSVDTAELDFTSGVNRSLLMSLAIALGISGLLSAYLSKLLSRPIVNLTEVTKSIRSGQLNRRAEERQSVRELTELSGAVNDLAQTLSHQSEIRKRLTSDLAHELRTPLTIIQGQLDAILEGIFEATPDRLIVARSETERLIGLVERLREIADLEDDTVALTYEDIDLSAIVQDAVTLFEADAMTRGQTLTSDLSPVLPMVGDAHRLRQVLVNLLSNAVKYTPDGGRIRVETRTIGSTALLKIFNTGAGILPEDLPFLFDRFYRADVSRHRETGGSGIGLTIVKLIVDAHKGSIDVKSDAQTGTTFTVTLPLQPPL